MTPVDCPPYHDGRSEIDGIIELNGMVHDITDGVQGRVCVSRHNSMNGAKRYNKLTRQESLFLNRVPSFQHTFNRAFCPV